MQQVPNLLPALGIQSFGEPAENEVHRKTIVAVIYNPADETFLCQYWADYNGLTCLLSGGIEDDEDPVMALRREISEETGYKDFRIVGTLGGTVYSHYYKAKTDEHFVKAIVPFLVVLNSTERADARLEADEKFENLFKSSDDMLAMMSQYEHVSGSTLADHKEILSRGTTHLASSSLS